MLEDDLEHTLGHRAEIKGPLVRCPTCRNECSPRAAMCPKCGEPLLGDDLKKLDTQFSAWGTTEEDKTGKK